MWRNSGKKSCSNLARLSLAIHLSVAALAAGTPTSVSAGSEDFPRGPYYLVKGLPVGATLSGGQTNAEHTWKVPLWALDDLKEDPKDNLKIEIPSGLSGNLDLVVALVGSDGAVFAKRTVALRVKSALAATPNADAARGKQAASTASKARGATRAAELPGATSMFAGLGGLPEDAPLGPFVRIKGLPEGVTLSGAVPLANGERVWMVPLRVLDDLKIEIPPDLSGNLDLLFGLVDNDGVVLSERTVEVRVTPAVTPPSPPQSGEAPDPAVARLAPTSSGAASGKAELAATSGPEPKAAQRKDATVATAVPSAVAVAAMLVKRGQDFIANGDLGAARLVLRRAADGGDARAALLLGSTYDPATFKHFRMIGLTPDPAQARAWYRRAVDLGSAEAVRRLQPLAPGAR